MLVLILGGIAVTVVVICGVFVLKRVRKIWLFRKSHAAIASAAEDIAGAARIAAAVAVAAVFFLTPTGLLAFFAAKPLIVLIAPAVIGFATLAAALSAAGKIYSKRAAALSRDSDSTAAQD